MQSDKSKLGAAGKPGVRVNPAVLGRAIWRATVVQEKKLTSKEQRQAQWQADREEYLELGRKVAKEIRAMRRQRPAAAGEKQ
jgi:hypothetical protein